MEDESLDDSSHKVLNCNEKNYLNSIVFGDLNDTSTYLSDSSEEETEMYINKLIKRLTALDKDIWYSIEVIQNNVCNNLTNLCDLLSDLPDRTVEFKNLVSPLKRIEDLTLSIERKYDKTHKLRQLKNLKTMLMTNQKVFSLIYNWDDNIRSVQSIISLYLSHKENLSTRDSLKTDSNTYKYVIFNSEGFSLDNLDSLKSILIQLKGDYDTCLDNVINTNIPQTLAIILDKYYIILEDLTLDIISFVLFSFNFSHYLSPGNDGSDLTESLGLNDKPDLMDILDKYVSYYLFENDVNNNMLNRHLRNKLEEFLMNYLKNLCLNSGLDLFSRSNIDLLNNLDTVNDILNGFFHYFFLLFITFRDSYNFTFSKSNRNMDSHPDPLFLSNDTISYSRNDLNDHVYSKLITNILSSCILNINLYYSISRLPNEDDIYKSLSSLFQSFEVIFTSYHRYIDFLNFNKYLEKVNFIPFDILDTYTLITFNKIPKHSSVNDQYKELSDCTHNFKRILNTLQTFMSSDETNKSDQVQGDGVNKLLKSLSMYIMLNNIKVEYNKYVDQTTRFVFEYFKNLAPKVEVNPINTSFESTCRNFVLELLEVHNSLTTIIGDRLKEVDSLSVYKIEKNILNCLKEKHDWKLSPLLLQPFRDVVFGNEDSMELVNEFDINPLLYTINQYLSKYIANNISYLIQSYYTNISFSETVNPDSVTQGHKPSDKSDEGVDIFIQYIAEYYINLLPIYCENTETFKILQKSLELFIDAEFESLTRLKRTQNFKNNINYLIKIARLLKINTNDSLSMLL